ncbi:MAG: N-acetylmuramoyl-L-alanine amidase [Patiriisocius sp.]|jgi:N-acetylmuramoyl-L-alanine amidase
MLKKLSLRHFSVYKSLVIWAVFVSGALFIVTTQAVSAQQASIADVRFSDTTDLARIVIEFDIEPTFSYFSLTNPNRVVVDLQNVDPAFDLSVLTLSGNKVVKVRHSTPKTPKDSRIVIETSKILTSRLFTVAPFNSGNTFLGHRLVIELIDPNPGTMQELPSANSSSTTKSFSNKAVNANVPNRDKDIIVVIDAGHGGIDPGSIGPAGTYEKNITLSISKMLAKKINAQPGLRAVLTREGDYYISPNDRPKIAVKEKADLMVSIHADAFTTPQPRGGSVWVLSKGRADSELGRLLEQTERSSELLGPAADVIEDRDTERYFAETILNMSMDLFRALSYELSHEVIKDMKGVTKMHKKTPQSASLAVLTAAETPSILVEVGFISNPQEEKNLNWAKHRQRLANSLFVSIERYFKKTPPDGTTWAYNKHSAPVKHRVARGESLSILAQRYGVSVKELKAQNKLKSDLVRIGQVLTIPK